VAASRLVSAVLSGKLKIAWFIAHVRVVLVLPEHAKYRNDGWQLEIPEYRGVASQPTAYSASISVPLHAITYIRLFCPLGVTEYW